MQCYNCDSNKLVCDVQKDAYVCMNCGYEYPKQYFFISHSHKDIEKVRIVRNIIEETFFYEPILFFLKCVSNETELNDLLQREIYERIWFVYCNSENAAKSKYVQFERDYIAKLKSSGKKINEVSVELDEFDIWDKECYNHIKRQIEFSIRKTKLFLSYSHCDGELVSAVKEQLLQAGFSVWSDLNLKAGDDWFGTVESKIKEHSYRDGAILVFISKNILNNRAAIMEIKQALDAGALVIPVLIGTKNEPALWQEATRLLPQLIIYRHLNSGAEITAQSVQKLIEDIKTFEVHF